MSEWQPIKTAPKSGEPWPARTTTEVLLTDGNSIYLGFWNGHSWDDGDFHDDMGEMTHWMPLPELPTSPPDTGGRNG